MKLYYANIDSMDLERCFDDDDVFVLYSPAPLSPDVEAAVGRIGREVRDLLDEEGEHGFCTVRSKDVDTLIRAVRAPRMTGVREMKTTLQAIRDHNPCADGWAKLRKSIGARKSLSTVVTLAQILESNGLDGAIWVLRAFPENEREARLFACACACRVAHLNPNVHVRRAIETAALFADGLADAGEMAAARAAAGDATWDAAGAAARAAAWDAAWDAERLWQIAEFLRMCRGEGIYAPLEA